VRDTELAGSRRQELELWEADEGDASAHGRISGISVIPTGREARPPTGDTAEDLPMAKLRIVIALYPGITHLDFTGPHQVLVRTPDAEVVVASLGGRDIEAEGLVFSQLADLAAIPSCDVLLVPGGLGAMEAILDEPFLTEIRRLAAGARSVTSVCTGSLILGAAGLLQGKRAACHWAFRELLEPFGAIVSDARVERDGRLITGGGVTAGIDFAFVLLAELAGTAYAQSVQLGLEYAPAPPFAAGRPELAPPEVLARVQERLHPLAAKGLANAREAARRLQPV
jgi:cyclohexyl-isocyanide hydratase